jgi:glycosidase
MNATGRPGVLRRNCLSAAVVFSALIVGGSAPDRPIAFRTAGGDAWTFTKQVQVTVALNACDRVMLTSSGATVSATPHDGFVSFQTGFIPGENILRAECRKNGVTQGQPAEQHWFVRLQDLPVAHIAISTEGSDIRLDASHSERAPVRAADITTYKWESRNGNPALLNGLPAQGRDIRLTPPKRDGDYYVTLHISDSNHRTDQSTVGFHVAAGRMEIIAAPRRRPEWIDHAVVYGVAPTLFGSRGLDDVTDRLDELQELGITTLWLSPITAAAPGDFGYAVTDLFHIRTDFGDESRLRELIAAAHKRDIRVVLDLVANHLSDRHPYFADTKNRGRASAYYGYFVRDAEGAPSHYFDWKNLENLDYTNPEVQNFMIEASLYWVRNFDIDGFRVDAAWGPRERTPQFWPRWRDALRRIKPDLLLLAEAPARDSYYFQSGFDAAYDWTARLGEWAWRAAFEHSSETAQRLKAMISNSKPNSDGLVFRFLDNNDTGVRFVTRYGLPRTRVASAMLLTLPGLPELYIGQDNGLAFEPYSAPSPIAHDDLAGLRPWYKELIALRHKEPALHAAGLQFVDISSSNQVLSYVRRGQRPRDSLLVILNYAEAPADVAIPANVFGSEARGRLRDLLSGQTIAVSASASTVAIDGYGIRILKRQ